MKQAPRVVRSILGIENPLVDFIGHVGHDVVAGLGMRAGTMNLVDEQTMGRVLATLPSCETVPGGSCANTMRGLAWLRGPGSVPQIGFGGAIGEDELGRTFDEGLRALRVEPYLARKGTRTGVSVILVTPDHERTMFTYLGACREYGPEDLPAGALDAMDLLYITGYLWDTEPQKAAMRRAVEAAQERGATVALDVADPFVVRRYREDFLGWIPGRVDLLFANSAELALLTGSDGPDEQTLRRAADLAPTVVMKVGRRGSLFLHAGLMGRVPARAAEVVDTTGAGDAFAAGYLHGLISGMDPEESSRIANRVARGVVSVVGCRYEGEPPSKG